MTQNCLHVFTRIYTEKRLTQRRKGRGALCPFVLMSKIVAHTENHRICSVCFCESLRRLRETITLRKVLCLPCLLCETTPRRLCETLRLCVRNICAQKEKHRILLRMLQRKSAPSAWDHNALFSVDFVWNNLSLVASFGVSSIKLGSWSSGDVQNQGNAL